MYINKIFLLENLNVDIGNKFKIFLFIVEGNIGFLVEFIYFVKWFYKIGNFYNDLCLEEMFFNFVDLCIFSVVLINNILK